MLISFQTMVLNYVRKTERQFWSKDAMRPAVEVTEGHTVEQRLYFDLISIQTSLCSVHVEQVIDNKAHPKVDEEKKSVTEM
jgi:hypothetical protein